MSVIYYSKFEIYNCEFNEIRDNKEWMCQCYFECLINIPNKKNDRIPGVYLVSNKKHYPHNFIIYFLQKHT